MRPPAGMVLNTQTDKDGKFVFTNINKGRYSVEISYVSYTPYSTAEFEVSGEGVLHLPHIRMAEARKNLQEVTINAIRKVMDIKPDKTTLNVAGSAILSGSAASELLQQIPGVSVNEKGQVRLNGKSGVTVMIDGKNATLSGDQLYEYLQSMQGESISKVEVYAIPPAKYDAAGAAGLINIITKKSNQKGFNGTITTGYNQGFFPNFMESVAVNYKRKKLNIYASYNYSNLRKSVDFVLDRAISGDQPVNIHEDTYFLPHFRNHTAKLGIDYDITKKDFISLNAYYNSFSKIRSIHDTSTASSSRPGIDSSYNTWTDNNKKLTNYAFTVNYLRNLSSSGHKIEFNYALSKFDNTDRRVNRNASYNNTDELIRPVQHVINNAPFNIYNHIGRIDYTLPLSNGILLEAGTKGSWTRQRNYLRYDSLTNGHYENVESRNNDYRYKEDVLAGYINAKKDIKGLTVLLGLRVEHTSSASELLLKDIAYKYDYTDFFPSASLSKKINRHHLLNLSYSRRINRPSYQDLDPTLIYVGAYYYVTGNPLLKPDYTSAVNLTETFRDRYSLTLGYSRTSHPITGIHTIDSITHVDISTSINLDARNIISLTLLAPFDIASWWTVENSVGGYYDQFKANNYLGRSYNKEQFVYNISTIHTFTLPASYRFDVSFKYESPRIFGLEKLESLINLSVGAQKSLLNKKANIKLSVYNILNKLNYVHHYVYANVNGREANYLDLRQLRLSFTYNFGTSQMKGRKSSADVDNAESRIKDR